MMDFKRQVRPSAGRRSSKMLSNPLSRIMSCSSRSAIVKRTPFPWSVFLTGLPKQSCAGVRGPVPTMAERNKTYGHYYGAAFQLKVPGQGEEPAALYTLWGLEDGRWRVIAWEVMGD